MKKPAKADALFRDIAQVDYNQFELRVAAWMESVRAEERDDMLAEYGKGHDSALQKWENAIRALEDK